MSAPIHTATPNVYLSKENGELVLRQGINPLQDSNKDKRILIIGGGVTGMTVCYMPREYLPRSDFRSTECLGIFRCWVLSYCRLRPLGIPR